VNSDNGIITAHHHDDSLAYHNEIGMWNRNPPATGKFQCERFEAVFKTLANEAQIHTMSLHRMLSRARGATSNWRNSAQRNSGLGNPENPRTGKRALHFGLRRQSAAATAPRMTGDVRLSIRAPKAAWRFASRRSPKRNAGIFAPVSEYCQDARF